MAKSRGSSGDASVGGPGATGGSTDQGQPAVEQIQEQATRLVDLGREQINARIGAQKEAAAGALGALATALREAGRQVGEQDEGQGQVARVVDAAAGQVEQVSEALRTQDIDQLVATVGDYARRQPAPFLAAAFALGFAGMRFFRSSTPPRRDLAIAPSGAGGAPDWSDRYAMTGSGSGSGYGFGYGSAGAYESAGVNDAGTYASSTLPTAGLAAADLAGDPLADDPVLAEIDIEVVADEFGRPGDAGAGGRGAGVGGL